jgi:leader peptidase (prepilin peptidase)/N-methyltransferase
MNEILELFKETSLFYYLVSFVVSMCVGSFLNVVIYRLPKMMENEWKAECSLLLADNLKSPYEASTKAFNLVSPSSTCPHCHTKIKPWFNLPVFGWLFLRGKAACCGEKISVRYPSIELLTGLSGLVIAYYFGVTEQALLYLLLTYALITLIFIDIDHMLLPDQITLPLLWLVLLASVMGLTIDPAQAIIGAVTGYLVFWTVYWAFKLLTGKEGMGYGDFKLMAVFGALLGWQALPMIVLMSSLVGAVIGITLLSIQGKDKATPIPFGPYIAIAGWISLIWGEAIQSTYFNLITP